MRIFFLSLVACALAACNAPRPAVLSITPAVSPSLIPAVSPSLIPSVVPSPTPAATAEPTRVTSSSRPVVLLPALDQTIDLGPIDFGNPLSPRPAVLDDQADRIYLSVSPSRTIVLAAETLQPVGEIPFGGTLSLDPAGQRLYIGVPGTYAYNLDNTLAITPAELKLIDTSNLALLRSAIYSDTSTTAPLVAVDAINNRLYVTQDGLIRADAATLEAQGTLDELAGTAVEAALLPRQQRLFVRLNNDIPGSNNGNTLTVYDLATGQVIAQDFERSVDGFTVDETHDEVYAPRSNLSTVALVRYDAQGRALNRLDGTGGAVLVDPRHERVYLFQWRDHSSLKVFDRDLNFLGAVRFPEITTPQMLLLDQERDRILVLQNGGRLAVLTGQGQPLDALEAGPAPDRAGVQLIVPARALFAVFAPDEFSTHQGSVFRSDDDGATWQFAPGLPTGAITDLKVADQLLFAAAGSNGTTDGYGVWRSADGGQAWQPASHGLTDLSVTRLAVSPDFARDGTLFALSKRGVFRSTDRGETWTSLADRYASLLQDLTVNFNTIALSPAFAQDSTVLIGHTSGLWRSTDRGETWTIGAGGPAANRLAFAPDGSLVLALNYEGVQRSDDGGLTWRLANAGLDPVNSTISDVQITDREAVILVTRFDRPGVLYRLPVGESTWQPLALAADVRAFALTRAGALFAGTSDGTVQRER